MKRKAKILERINHYESYFSDLKKGRKIYIDVCHVVGKRIVRGKNEISMIQQSKVDGVEFFLNKLQDLKKELPKKKIDYLLEKMNQIDSQFFVFHFSLTRKIKSPSIIN